MPSQDPTLPIEVDCRTVQAARDAGEDFLFVDCREPDEFAQVRIDGTSLVPMREIPSRIVELAGEPQRRIVVHCHHGGRSLKAANWLRQNGYPNAQSMAGGIDAWALEIEPGMRRY
ncbi:MAG TPA: rhodanese-like domain-containing protein [Pirellulales bacterium]|jgi:rhodanese-related sulfurtransferase|nr:rhodanese-like domain-containing protein [Pirellulales bacterium]